MTTKFIESAKSGTVGQNVFKCKDNQQCVPLQVCASTENYSLISFVSLWIDEIISNMAEIAEVKKLKSAI